MGHLKMYFLLNMGIFQPAMLVLPEGTSLIYIHIYIYHIYILKPLVSGTNQFYLDLLPLCFQPWKPCLSSKFVRIPKKSARGESKGMTQRQHVHVFGIICVDYPM